MEGGGGGGGGPARGGPARGEGDQAMMGPESIHKVARRIKRTEQTLYNALRSIYEDSLFVREIRGLWAELPLLANLRCGSWYAAGQHDGTCYFKSTDGHNGNWSFSTVRLNLHAAALAAERGGCCIVDATRKGKRFPDSMSKTIPIWTCVLNRALADFRPPHWQGTTTQSTNRLTAEEMDGAHKDYLRKEWDCSLHLPIWVSHVERAHIESKIEGWVESLKSSGADLITLAAQLKKPLRPLWMSQKTVIWLNEVPDLDDWEFTPIILISASRPSLFVQRLTDAEFSWTYIPGAADDEESWARGLTSALFWKHSRDIISGGPGACNRMVSEIVERDRVYNAVRGYAAPQFRNRARSRQIPEDAFQDASSSGIRDPQNCSSFTSSAESQNGFDERIVRGEGIPALQAQGRYPAEQVNDRSEDFANHAAMPRLKPSRSSLPSKDCSGGMPGFHWIGSTGLAVGRADVGLKFPIDEVVDSIVNCGTCSSVSPIRERRSHLYLPIVGSKFNRQSLQRHLSEAVSFSEEKLRSGSTVFVCCATGEDISVCVCLAVLLSCFSPDGQLEERPASAGKLVNKADVRERLVYLSNFNSDARPSRGSLRQVFNFFNSTDACYKDLRNSHLMAP